MKKIYITPEIEMIESDEELMLSLSNTKLTSTLEDPVQETDHFINISEGPLNAADNGFDVNPDIWGSDD